MSATDRAETTSYATTRKFEKVCEILDRHGRDPAKLIPILQQVQDEYRYLPEAVLTYVATSLGVPPARVYGVATFYAHFTLKPKGKYVVRVCNGTACNVKGSMDLLEAVKKRLGMREDQDTTGDMLFTVETVSCLGACGLAPAMVVNDSVYGQVTPDKAVSVVESILAEEASA